MLAPAVPVRRCLLHRLALRRACARVHGRSAAFAALGFRLLNDPRCVVLQLPIANGGPRCVCPMRTSSELKALYCSCSNGRFERRSHTVHVCRFRVTDPERRSNREWTILRILQEEKRDEPTNTRCGPGGLRAPVLSCLSFIADRLFVQDIVLSRADVERAGQPLGGAQGVPQTSRARGLAGRGVNPLPAWFTTASVAPHFGSLRDACSP